MDGFRAQTTGAADAKGRRDSARTNKLGIDCRVTAAVAINPIRMIRDMATRPEPMRAVEGDSPQVLEEGEYSGWSPVTIAWRKKKSN